MTPIDRLALVRATIMHGIEQERSAMAALAAPKPPTAGKAPAKAKPVKRLSAPRKAR